jgi:hypothetical protein
MASLLTYETVIPSSEVTPNIETTKDPAFDATSKGFRNPCCERFSQNPAMIQFTRSNSREPIIYHVALHSRAN